MEDEQLLQGLAMDLDGNFERLVVGYQNRMYAFALNLCGSQEDAEEIAQDSFVRAYRALQGYPSERVLALKLQAWLYRITLNVFRNRVRRRRVRVVPLDGHDESIEDKAMDGPEMTVEQHEDRDELRRLLTRLPERFRAAVILRYIEGMDYVQVAMTLEQPQGTVKSNVHRGIALLRQAVQESTAKIEVS